jgi:radical SAM protein with 4Fe4S-binding SPASM domain
MDDLGDNLCVVWLWCWGEPFLNKNIYDMIHLARSKNIIVISSTNANLPFDGAEIEELLRSGLSQLIVAIDGIDQDTYSTYRIGGKLDLVLDNIRNLVDHKKRLGQERPLINMRMLVMYHNQHQIEEFRTLAESLKVDIVSYKTQCDYRKGDDIPSFPSIRKYHRYAIDEESKNILDMKQHYYCNRPWRRIQVFADGAITPCEFDIEREVLLGNIYDGKTMNSCWNSKTAVNFRRQFLADIDEISFCSNCPYKNQVMSDPTVEYYNLTESARS